MAFDLDIENVALVQNQDRLGRLILDIATVLVAKGWTIEGSGDGIATFQNRTQTAGPYNVFTSGVGYHNTSGVWTTSLGGANSISNTRAWIIIKEPAPSTRALMFQRSSQPSTAFECFLNIEFSFGGYATSGATATSPPAGVGGLVALLHGARNGAGTDFIGTSAVEINDPVTLIANFLVSDSARAGDCWPFRLIVYNSTTTARVAAIVYESMIEAIPGDSHPCIIAGGAYVSVLGTTSAVPTLNYWGVRDTGVIASNFGFWYHTLGAFGSVPSASVPLANVDGKIRPLPVYVGIAATANGTYKGRCEYLQYNYQARNYPSTLDYTTADPYLYAGLFMLNWKTNVVPGT